MKFDHIGVFVRTIAEGGAQLSAMLPVARRSEIYTDPLIRVHVQFLYDAGGLCYELVAPYGEGNPVDGALKTRRNILNHVAYRTASLDGELAKLREQGAVPLGEPKPAVAFGGRRVVFVMTPLNFVIELIEE
jgi:methylmalonyl-CoA/ethylmalonyl-CoA epimerase